MGAFREHVLDYREHVVKILSPLTMTSGELHTIKMHNILIKTRIAIETLLKTPLSMEITLSRKVLCFLIASYTSPSRTKKTSVSFPPSVLEFDRDL
jgi:hypothetical protein